MQQQADEDELGLSCAALAALKEFALENNLLGPCDRGDSDVRLQVQERMDVKDKDHDFRFAFGDEGDEKQVYVVLSGVNPELGQTLASTGLTVWRAAQEMARFMWEQRQWFVGKSVLELGAGLGLCGVLASHLCVGGKVVITDGGEEFTDSAKDALRKNLEKNSCRLTLAAAESRLDVAEDARGSLALRSAHPNASEGGGDDSVLPAAGGDAEVVLDRLTWGDHKGFLERYGGGGGGSGADGGDGKVGFDFVVAADVIYEEEAVTPLLCTVVDILRLRQAAGCKRPHAEQPPHQQQQQRREEHSRSESSPVRQGDEASAGDRGANASAAAATGAGGGDRDCVEDVASTLPPPPSLSAAAPPPLPPSTFLLAFARRNVSIERVLREAEGLGLRWTVPENFEPTSSSENIYLMCLDSAGEPAGPGWGGAGLGEARGRK